MHIFGHNVTSATGVTVWLDVTTTGVTIDSTWRPLVWRFDSTWRPLEWCVTSRATDFHDQLWGIIFFSILVHAWHYTSHVLVIADVSHEIKGLGSRLCVLLTNGDQLSSRWHQIVAETWMIILSHLPSNSSSLLSTPCCIWHPVAACRSNKNYMCHILVNKKGKRVSHIHTPVRQVFMKNLA